jgi:hypothetical protein
VKRPGDPALCNHIYLLTNDTVRYTTLKWVRQILVLLVRYTASSFYGRHRIALGTTSVTMLCSVVTQPRSPHVDEDGAAGVPGNVDP